MYVSVTSIQLHIPDLHYHAVKVERLPFSTTSNHNKRKKKLNPYPANVEYRVSPY